MSYMRSVIIGMSTMVEKMELAFKTYIHKHICRRKYFKDINTNILTPLAQDEQILFSSFHLSVFPKFYILM